MHAPTWSALVLALLFVFLSGCAQIDPMTGDLKLQSHNANHTQLVGSFSQAFFSHDADNNLTVILIDGAPQTPSRAVCIRMLWEPRPGLTPIHPTATNASIHYLVFTGSDTQQVGLYAGAGFIFPRGNLDGESLRLSIWDSNLLLQDRTPGFQDLLGHCKLTGQLTAVNDPAQTRLLNEHLQQWLTGSLAYPRLVLH